MASTVNRQAIIEAVKEVLRLALFAAASAIVAWASNQLAGLDPGSTGVVIGTVVLRFVDKWIHENGNIDANGLTKF